MLTSEAVDAVYGLMALPADLAAARQLADELLAEAHRLAYAVDAAEAMRLPAARVAALGRAARDARDRLRRELCTGPK